MINIYLSPSESIDGIKTIIKVNGERVQVNNKLYDFTNHTDGILRASTGDIINAKRINGVLSLEIDNEIVSSKATQEDLYPQWQSIDRNDVLDEDVEIVRIEWITLEELETIENAPKPPTLEEQLIEKEEQILKLKEEQYMTQQLTIENAKTQQELIELLMDMEVII